MANNQHLGTSDLNENEPMLKNRVAELERRMSMFEGIFHALSNRLDLHFKKYDVVVNSQQQQINELTAFLSTLLNDQQRHAEILSEKLSGTLHGVSATSISLSQTLDPQGFTDGPSAPNTQRNYGSVSLNNETANTQNEGAVSNETLFEDILNGNSQENDKNQQQPNGSNPISQENSSHPTVDSRFSKPQNYNPTLVTTLEDYSTNPPNNDGGQSQIYINGAPSQSQQSPDLQKISSDRENAVEPSVQESVPTFEEEQYETKTGLKRKRIVCTRPFEFIKSPHSVMEVWKEYTEGVNGQPSIRKMEALYQTAWRRDPAVNKRYSRRKVLWKAIQTGLNRGYSLNYVVEILENSRYVNDKQKVKQPIGWLCHSSHIPEILK
ncbi:msn1p [Saccharomyces arboricola H-6]|uniref:Msn1p n=1 Tax=Saccharomyces arboricola (strain H-6 / AS 2.3317 / CBS 10644) TaxID=1160507 RepID=J8LIE7_SACAR|nr:msn1p [Saccharomyces arboricola H-6]